MIRQPLDKQMGPKVIKKERLDFFKKQAEGDCEPDDEDEQSMIQRVQVSYIHNVQPRYDSTGREIKKGGEYSIQFVPYITVCLYEPQEDAL